MIEELKILVDLLKGATDTALYAFIAMGVYKLAYLSIIVGPSTYIAKLFITRLFVDGDSKASTNEKTKPTK